MRTVRLLALGAAAAALGGCGSAGNTASSGNTGGASLTASPAKPSFHRNEPVSLNVTLTNHGSAPISASSSALGTLLVISLERDGKPVVPRHSSLDTLESLATLLHASLRTVRPGDSLGLAWQSSFDQGAGGQGLYSVHVTRLQNALDVYSVSTPGAYVLKLAYEYPAAAKPSSSTLTGPTQPAAVSFNVTP